MSTYTDPTKPVTAANRQKVVNYALAQVGKPYKWAAAGPDSFDCSGLIVAAWKQAGLILPHQSGQQAAALKAMPYSIEARDKVQPGDVFFYYGSTKDYPSITHCALYVGEDERPVDGQVRFVVAAVDDEHGVMRHWIRWALTPCGIGYVGHR